MSWWFEDLRGHFLLQSLPSYSEVRVNPSYACLAVEGQPVHGGHGEVLSCLIKVLSSLHCPVLRLAWRPVGCFLQPCQVDGILPYYTFKAPPTAKGETVSFK